MNIEAKELSKIYGSGESRVVALDKVNLEIASSDFISIMGPSGSGKSTLLHLLSGLDKPTSGSLTYDGKDIYRFNDKELSSFRRRRIGFIFQQFNLLPVLTAKSLRPRKLGVSLFLFPYGSNPLHRAAFVCPKGIFQQSLHCP